MHALVSLGIAAAAMLRRAFASVNSLYKPAQPWVQQQWWEGCCWSEQAGRMEAGPGPDLLLVMGLMRRQTRSIMAVVMVMTTNQVTGRIMTQACLMKHAAAATQSLAVVDRLLCMYCAVGKG
ncbi:TPA: hypothetical protein ACH3X2_002816 [Trebouxia sp. C0005]